MQRLWTFSLLLSLAIVLPGSIADEKKAETPAGEKGKREFKATCPVSGGEAKREQSIEYKEKKVFFCCEKCKAAFEADKAKYATKANMQLAQTRQYVQTSCPLSGGKVNKEQTAEVSGVKVQFCCEKCKGAIAEASADDQVAKVFADDVFAKSFEARKRDPNKKKGGEEKSESTESK